MTEAERLAKTGCWVLGFVSNEAAISTIARLLPNCLVLSDELNHSSMIEGVRRSGAEKKVFRHNDVAHLESLLQAAGRERAKLIVFESVYSMDGDIAPIEAGFEEIFIYLMSGAMDNFQ